MKCPPLDPCVDDVAPTAGIVTGYDEQHLVTYLRLLDAAADHVEILLEQHEVGGRPRDVDRALDGQAGVGGVHGRRVVDAVAEEADVRAEAALGADDARLLLRSHTGEDRGPRQQLEERVVAQRRDLGAREDRSGVHADVPAEVRRDLAVVAGDDLDGDAETVETGERLLHVGLGGVGEAEEAVQGEVALVVAAQTIERVGPAGDRDDAGPGSEESVEGRVSRVGHLRTACEDAFGGALDDQQASLRRLDEDRGEPALVIERATSELFVRIDCENELPRSSIAFSASAVARLSAIGMS